ncbi:MAG: MTH938/NDUFAF3 family protein [Candidatus Korarchaeota archaeon]
MRIDSYEFGRIKIDGKEYYHDVILSPNREITKWWRKEGHVFSIEDLPDCVMPGVEFLIVGTGAYGRVDVLKEVEEYVEKLGIKLISAPTREAVDRYNELVSKGHVVVGAFHLTC